MSKNLLKLKIENIAKKLINKNQIQLNNYNTREELDINQLNSDESTIKDSLSEFEEISKSINSMNSIKNAHKDDDNNKNNFISSQNYQNSNINNKNHHSSLCTKTTSLTDNNNSGGGTLDYYSNLDMNKMKSKNSNLLNKNYINSSELLIKRMVDNNINNFNLDSLNNIMNIYNKLLELFNFNPNKFHKNDKLIEQNIKKEINRTYNEIKILSYKYINFVFGEDMNSLVRAFYNDIELNKYFISQIYLFISIIYLFEESIISNSYLLISYKSIMFYSLLNLKNVLNLVKLISLNQNEKLLKNIKSVNKIILSILKIINPKVPSNAQIIDFISPNKCSQNNSLNTTISKSMKYSGLLRLISLLKDNANLKERLLKIEKINLSFIEENLKIEKEKEKENESAISEEKKTSKSMNEIKSIGIGKIKEKKDANKPILPPMDNKYKYTIAIELDETLVHYCEDGENYYAKVRFGSENFLKNISDFFEIVVISSSGKEYSNIIIDNINKDEGCFVEHRIFTEDFLEGQSLLNINRDFKKLIFVCHDYDFFNAPKENIILLKEFLGEEEDREIIKLYNEIKLLIDEDNKIEKEIDIRNLIPKIMERINLNIDYIDYLEEDKEEENENEEKEENIEKK